MSDDSVDLHIKKHLGELCLRYSTRTSVLVSKDCAKLQKKKRKANFTKKPWPQKQILQKKLLSKGNLIITP